ncbi:MAG TPA: F0F1 ATP synthase subunit B [Thermoguttaceae bacterium]|nr:F0F1 ATP synthase subunit B [Thermoguttaceae bacterium]
MMFHRLVSALAIGLVLAALGSVAFAVEDTHASGDESGGGGINPLSLEKIQTDLAIWTGVVFLLLLAILWKFAWGPITQGLDRREQGIADQIDQAEQSNKEARELLGQYGQKLAGAKEEVRDILAQGRRDAEQLGQEMLEKTRQEARAEQQRALRQIDDATAAALKELAAKGADLAVNLAGRIVRAELKAGDHAKLIERTVSDFAKQGSPGNGTT